MTGSVTTCLIILSLVVGATDAALQMGGAWTEGGPSTTGDAISSGILGGGSGVAMSPDGRHLFTTAAYQGKARESNCVLESCTAPCKKYQAAQDAGGDDDAVSVFEVQGNGTLHFVMALKDVFQGEGNILHTIPISALLPEITQFLHTNLTKRDPRGLVPCLDGVNDVVVSANGRSVVVVSSKGPEGDVDLIKGDTIDITVGLDTIPFLNVFKYRGRCVTIFNFDPATGDLEYEPLLMPDFSVNPDYNTDKPATQPYVEGLVRALAMVKPDPPVALTPDLELLGGMWYSSSSQSAAIAMPFEFNNSTAGGSISLQDAVMAVNEDGYETLNFEQGGFVMSADARYLYFGGSVDSVRAVEVYRRLRKETSSVSTPILLKKLNPPLRNSYLPMVGQKPPVSTTTCLALSPDGTLLYAGFVAMGPFIPDAGGGVTVFSRDTETGLLSELYEVQGRRQATVGGQPMPLDPSLDLKLSAENVTSARVDCSAQVEKYPDAGYAKGMMCAQWHMSLVPRTIMPHPDGRRVFVLGGNPKLVDGHAATWWDPEDRYINSDPLAQRPDSSRLTEYRWECNATHNFAELWFAHGSATECCAPWRHPMSHSLVPYNPPEFPEQVTWHTYNAVPSMSHASSAVMDPTGSFIYVISERGGDNGKGALTWFSTNTTRLEVASLDSATINVTLLDIVPVMKGDIRDCSVRVKVGRWPCPSCVWSDRGLPDGPATLRCSVPDGIGQRLPVSLQYFHDGDGLNRFITVAERLDAYNFTAVHVAAVHPMTATPGDRVTLVGEGFGPSTAAQTSGELYSQGTVERLHFTTLNVFPAQPRQEGESVVIPLNATTLLQAFPSTIIPVAEIPMYSDSEVTLVYRNLKVEGGCPSALYPGHCVYNYTDQTRRISIGLSKKTLTFEDFGWSTGEQRDLDWHTIRVRFCNGTQTMWLDDIQQWHVPATPREFFLDIDDTPHVRFYSENFPMEISTIQHAPCDDSLHATIALSTNGICQDVFYINSTAVHCTIPLDAPPTESADLKVAAPRGGTDFSLLPDVAASGLLQIMCAKGFYHDLVKDQCADCLAGTYNNVTNSQCKSCPPGYSCSERRQVIPLVCGPGTSSTAGQSSCNPCEIGTFAPVSGASECTQCPKGHYCPTTSMTAALLCQPGSFQNGVRAAACVLCPRGEFSAAAVATKCTDCPVNTYSDEDGSTGCTPCPYASQSSAKSNDVSQCSCPPITSYGDHTRNISCNACPVGADCSTLKAGNNPYPQPNPGKWNSHLLPNYIHTCTPSSACEGQVETCADGYTGEACSECLDNFYRQSDGNCNACVEEHDVPLGVQWLILILFCIGVVALVIVAFFFATLIEHYVAKRNAAKDALAGMSVPASSRGSGLGRLLTKALKRLKKLPFLAGRILRLGQLTSMVLAMQAGWPDSLNFVQDAMNTADIVSYGPGLLGRYSQEAMVGCTVDEDGNKGIMHSPFTKFVVKMLVPLLVLAASAVLIVLSVLGAQVSSRGRILGLGGPPLGKICRSVTNVVIKGILLLSQTIYLPLSSAILDAFTCVERISGRFFLLSEPSIQCFVGGGEWTVLAVVASLFFFLYVTGIPVIFGIILYWIRNRREEPEIIKRYGMLYTHYEAKFYWYELVILGQKFLFAASLPLVVRGITQQLNYVLLVSNLSVIFFLPAMPYEDSQDDFVDLMINLFVMVLATGAVMFNAGSLTVEANFLIQALVVGGFLATTLTFAIVGLKEFGVFSQLMLVWRKASAILNLSQVTAGTEGRTPILGPESATQSAVDEGEVESLRSQLLGVLNDGLDAGLWADDRLHPDALCQELYTLVKTIRARPALTQELFERRQRRLLISLLYALRVAEGVKAEADGRPPAHLSLLPCSGTCKAKRTPANSPRLNYRCICRELEDSCVAFYRFVESLELQSAALRL